MLERVGFMLPSKADRRRNSLPVAHSKNCQAALLSLTRLFMTTDHVQRFGRRKPDGPDGGRA